MVSIKHIEAVAGEPVYLPCDITTVEKDDAVLLVLWYREDLGTPIYRSAVPLERAKWMSKYCLRSEDWTGRDFSCRVKERMYEERAGFGVPRHKGFFFREIKYNECD
ncbi:hypothetical protein J437_LFUL003316 [Ladona fulva]|uniref:Uncharacterized protein n=1 Tax=Ladona fulva TaxID=123851 RepID=A0A8K0PA68_LADFU|nr:hypothetical protein J437_LFUL003316 [Ladona fulva]